MERGIRKIFTFGKLYVAPKLFGKIMLKPLKFRKDLSSPVPCEQWFLQAGRYVTRNHYSQGSSPGITEQIKIL